MTSSFEKDAAITAALTSVDDLLLAASVPPELVSDETATGPDPAPVDDAQWIPWSDAATESAWVATELAVDWAAALAHTARPR